MNTLATWLRTQLDEDEQALTRLAVASRLRIESEPDYRRFVDRTAAEIRAKRGVIEEHSPCGCSDHECRKCRACSGLHGADPTPSPCETLVVLAVPYADQPGYRTDWPD